MTAADKTPTPRTDEEQFALDHADSEIACIRHYKGSDNASAKVFEDAIAIYKRELAAKTREVAAAHLVIGEIAKAVKCLPAADCANNSHIIEKVESIVRELAEAKHELRLAFDEDLKMKCLKQQEVEIKDLKAEAERLREDAEKYLWLCDYDNKMQAQAILWNATHSRKRKSGIDAAIDAARAQGGEHEG